MPEPEHSHRGEKIQAFLTNKTGPLPNYVWIFAGVAVIAFFAFRNTKGKAGGKSGGGAGSPDASGNFTSTTTSTDPNTGTSTSYTATGPTSGFLTGGALTGWNAQPMGYSGGDVYVNYPGSTTDPGYRGPTLPPVNAPAAQAGQTGSYWWTLSSDTSANDLANVVYRLGNNMQNASPGAIQVMAADLVNIMHANPQIDWTRITNAGGKIPAGTALFVPIAGGGGAGAPPAPLAPEASLNAPPGYDPVALRATMTAAVPTSPGIW
jgi:hypothetical protein